MPAVIQQFAEFCKVIAFKNLQGLIDHVVHDFKLFLFFGHIFQLMDDDLRGGSGKSRKKKHKMRLQGIELLDTDCDLPEAQMVMSAELDMVEAAVSRQHL